MDITQIISESWDQCEKIDTSTWTQRWSCTNARSHYYASVFSLHKQKEIRLMFSINDVTFHVRKDPAPMFGPNTSQLNVSGQVGVFLWTFGTK